MKKRPLHFIGAAFLDNYLWVSALEWNGYYRLNLESGETEFLGIFNHADILASKLFFQVLSYRKYIFYIPWYFDYLVRLDTEDLSLRYWKLPENIVNEEGKFRAANLYDEKIFMFPVFAESVYIFDISKEKFECDNKFWINNKNDNIVGKGDFVQGCQINDILYLPNLSRSSVIEYKLTNYDFRKIIFPEDEKAMVSVMRYGTDKLLILSLRGNIWIYNLLNDTRKKLYEYNGKFEVPYSHIFVNEDGVYLIPEQEKNIKVLKEEKENILLYPYGWKKEYRNVGIESVFCSCNGNKIYPCKGNMLLEIKTGYNTNILGGMIFYDDKKHICYCNNWFVSKRVNKFLCVEQKNNDLGFFMSILENDEGDKKEIIKMEKGSLIWNAVKD